MAGSIFIQRFINFPVSSNCFVITGSESGQCILVDPALGPGEMLIEHMEQNGLRPVYIILTHEHFDHISSTDSIRERYNCKVIASSVCSASIGDAKKNLSVFYDQTGFACRPADILSDRMNTVLSWNENVLTFHHTPGHAEGSICFGIKNHLFTGDTVMKEYKPVVKLPGGNRKKLEESIKHLLAAYGPDTIVYPGHGEIFLLKDYKEGKE